MKPTIYQVSNLYSDQGSEQVTVRLLPEAHSALIIVILGGQQLNTFPSPTKSKVHSFTDRMKCFTKE